MVKSLFIVVLNLGCYAVGGNYCFAKLEKKFELPKNMFDISCFFVFFCLLFVGYCCANVHRKRFLINILRNTKKSSNFANYIRCIMKNIEIERKFLLRNDSWRALAVRQHEIMQGYIAAGEGNTVRVRRKDDKAYITIKSRQAACSISHFEWECEISLDDFSALFIHCIGCPIQKTRYIVPLGKEMSTAEEQLYIEIDEFHGKHEGLVFAEIELPSEDTKLTLPSFIGEEVTGDKRFYNSYLSSNEN